MDREGNERCVMVTARSRVVRSDGVGRGGSNVGKVSVKGKM